MKATMFIMGVCALATTASCAPNSMEEGPQALGGESEIVAPYSPQDAAPMMMLLIDCSSWHYHYQRCDVGHIIRSASLVQQYSHTDCVPGGNWGYDRDFLWVNGGCRGRFHLEADPEPAPHPWTPPDLPDPDREPPGHYPRR